MPTEEQTYRDGIMHRFDVQDVALADIKKAVTYTNGKVKKIIIALVLLGGIVIGQSTTNLPALISLFIHSSGV